MTGPHWLTIEAVLDMHSRMIERFGGSDGVRDKGLLESALNRPLNLFGYQKPSIFDLAAAYGFGLARNHPFVDGNKRTAFIATFAFLSTNGFDLKATEADATVTFLKLASGELPEAALARWLLENSVPR